MVGSRAYELMKVDNGRLFTFIKRSDLDCTSSRLCKSRYLGVGFPRGNRRYVESRIPSPCGKLSASALLIMA